MDLNRIGVATFELEGSGLFDLAYGLFGPDGFDRPLYGVLDEDARASWAEALNIAEADLEADGHFFVCNPDLEGLYVRTLGVARVLKLLLASPNVTEDSIRKACGGTQIADVSEELLADYCRHKKRKVRAALALAAGLTEAEAQAITTVADAVRAVSS